MSDTPLPPDDAVRHESARRTRRAFLTGGIAAVLGVAGFRWLSEADPEDRIPWPLRRALQLNERLARATFSQDRLTATYPPERAAVGDAMRVNGMIGMMTDFDPTAWRLTVDGAPRTFSPADLKALPRSSFAAELRCVEGWSQVMSFAGPSMRDFLTAHRLGTRDGSAPDFVRRPRDMFDYVGLETPDGNYFVGLDMASAWHPQTLLCDEMGGEPLTPDHGAPLRLAIPVKYGIKNIKRIGRIFFTDERPTDYWAMRGYDWYAGL